MAVRLLILFNLYYIFSKKNKMDKLYLMEIIDIIIIYTIKNAYKNYGIQEINSYLRVIYLNKN